jgi:hypothetical protein
MVNTRNTYYSDSIETHPSTHKGVQETMVLHQRVLTDDKEYSLF